MRSMSKGGFALDIHKVADNDKRLAMFLGIAFLFVWVVAINIGMHDMAPRWFLRDFDWLTNEEIPTTFLSMAFASLIAAALLWAFSGNGDKIFHINGSGIERRSVFSVRLYKWSDFERLDREVGKMVLHIKATTRGSYGPAKLVFDVSKIDCSGPQLEALLVHYRPDLYRTKGLAG
jgi:hypothetical protein